jgi:hypothetical protein
LLHINEEEARAARLADDLDLDALVLEPLALGHADLDDACGESVPAALVRRASRARGAPVTGSMFAKTGCATALFDSFFLGRASSLSKVMAMRSFELPPKPNMVGASDRRPETRPRHRTRRSRSLERRRRERAPRDEEPLELDDVELIGWRKPGMRRGATSRLAPRARDESTA